MDFFKTTKLALILGGTLLSASIGYADNRSNCAGATPCSTYTNQGQCSLSAQIGNPNASPATTTGWYGCYWSTSSKACEEGSNNTATCTNSVTGCSTNSCDSYTNEGTCNGAAVSSAGGTTGTWCTWTGTACTGTSVSVTCSDITASASTAPTKPTSDASPNAKKAPPKKK
jgi:hypothetical protein